MTEFEKETRHRLFLFIKKKKKKVDAYLRSPGLSVGNKLCFLCLHLPKFFLMQLLVYPATVFSRYARDAGFSHMYTELKTAFIM